MSRKISNYENFAQLSADHNRRRYTVERTESSVSNVSSRIENGQFIDAFISVLKWLTAIFVFSVVMFCVVASKICLLVLGEQFKNFNQTKTSALKEDVETSKQASILMLVLVLMIPQVVSFVYATWTNLRRESRPWPTKQGFILILIGGFLESLSLCYITIVGLTVLPVDPSAIVLLMCSLAVVPSIWQATKSRSRFNTMSGKLHVFKFGASAVIALLGIALLTWKTPDMSARIGIPIAFILLSIAWSPKLRKHQIRSKHQSAKEFRETTVRSSVSGVSGYMYNNDTEQGVTQGPPVKRRTACGKAAIVSSLWKLILTPFFALTFIKLYDIVELDNIFAGLRDINVSNSSFVYFMLHVFASFFGYHFGWLACSLCLQRVGYALPLTLATPIVIFMIHVTGICETDALPLSCRSEEQVYILPAGTLLWVAQFVSTTYYVWKGEGMILAKAQDLFWIPDYNGICLEQYLLLNRRNEASDEEHVTQQNLSRDIRVFICTTMYHEEDYEMEQLLRSIHDVDMNSGRTGHQFESHVFFDGCVRVEVLNSYALKLASLVEKALKVRLTECSKMKTPYGMQLKWRLPGGMDFIIHLKDNAKVKNKKRWSQVMYMSYVLDYKQRLLGVNDEQSFILTTDADVKFTHESVEALIDQIIEDPRTGAVCARTHPLGNGPVVWYQIFDYAIGHWFQKVANHMLGSVLCSPGCFSLYRCQAVREVLPTYATNVDHAFEFLTKDMGEDRWMCTLMVQRGWRLTYCAAAEDSTYCPESFDELYKQRRRWTPSTLANLVLLVSEWKRILKNNEHISFLFILYQTFLVCATVIGPSTVILVIVSGMLFSGLAVNEITIVVLISLVVVVYTLICLFTSQNFQLRVSKLLTFVFAVIMCIVFIGVAVKISNEIKGRPDESTGMPTPGPNSMESATSQSLEQHLPAGVSTLYLAGLSGIFIAAALLHPNEFTCLFHGIWYLLCLPSGYLLLTIYSLCNLTDRSWGTREEKSASQEEDWYKPIANLLMKICKCCQSQQTREERHAASQAKRRSIVESRTSIKAELTSSSNKVTESSDENGNKEMTSFTAKGEVFIKTETTEDTQTSKNLEATRPEKKSTKNPVNNASSGAEQNTSVAANDDADQNCQFPTTVVYSAQEIPRKSLATSSSKKSKEAWKLSTGEINEENSLKGAFHKSSSGESIDPLPGSYAQGSVSPEKIKTGDGVKREEYSSAKDHSANSLVHEGAMPQKSDVGQVISDGEMQKQTGKRKRSVPLRVSTLITSSASMFQESTDQPEKGDEHLMKNPELSVKFRSNLSLRTLHENDRPMTALKNDVSFSDLNLPVEEWLPRDFKRYASNFREHGYDTAGYLPGMTDKDLQLIGIHTRGHRQRLIRDIRKIPRVDIEEDIPQNVQEWLEEHGLGEYWPMFESSGYTEPSDLEDLKNINKDNLKETFNIQKPGHFNRLLSAIRKLQYPNQGQIKLRHTRRELDRLPLLYLDVDNQDDGIEYEFWEGLRQTCLVPESSAFDQTSKLKEKLVELRNTTLLVFGVSNALWMIIILTLVRQKELNVFGVDVIGLAFLLIYGFLIILQFLALLGHRFKTIVHILARTPWTLSKKVGNNRVSSFESESSHPTR